MINSSNLPKIKGKEISFQVKKPQGKNTSPGCVPLSRRGSAQRQGNFGDFQLELKKKFDEARLNKIPYLSRDSLNQWDHGSMVLRPRGALEWSLCIQLYSIRSLIYLDFLPAGWAWIKSRMCISTSSKPLWLGPLKC